MSASDEVSFESLEWNEIDRTPRRLTPERTIFLAGVAIVLAIFLYDHYVAHVYLVFDWRVDLLDYAFLIAVVAIIAYGAVPAIRNRGTTESIIRYVRARPVGIVAIGYLLVVAIVGVFGPLVLSANLQFNHGFHAPLGFHSSVVPGECVGRETGDVFNRLCHGSLEYPLGTNYRGHPMEYLLMRGARVAIYVAVISTVFVFPIATGVGVIAGVYGGIVDDLLMSYVDVQLSIPAIVFYLIGYMYWNPSLLLLIGAFGLLSWGGIARLVRSEVIQRREAGHVRVARSLGASTGHLAKRHLLPNTTNTLVPMLFHLLALYILVEAGVAFLGFYQIDLYSWGMTITEALPSSREGQMGHDQRQHPVHKVWWITTFPALALAGTILALKVTGDMVRDALDPRRYR